MSFLITASAQADIIAYTDLANQGIPDDAPGNFDLLFKVNSPINITALGIFNDDGSGYIKSTVQVVIFNDITKNEVTPVVKFHGQYIPMGAGFDVFQSINPVTLSPGNYAIDEVGLEQNGSLMGNRAH